jgi:hypothetical protein
MEGSPTGTFSRAHVVTTPPRAECGTAMFAGFGLEMIWKCAVFSLGCVILGAGNTRDL